MSLMDRVKSGIEKAKEEASDLARTTRIRREIAGLERSRTEAVESLAAGALALHAEGRAPATLVDLCDRIAGIDHDIASRRTEIERIDREDGA